MAFLNLRTPLCKSFDQHVIYEQVRVLNVVEDLLRVEQVPETSVCAKDHKLVEDILVLVELGPQDLGQDLFELTLGFAVLEILDA